MIGTIISWKSSKRNPRKEKEINIFEEFSADMSRITTFSFITVHHFMEAEIVVLGAVYATALLEEVSIGCSKSKCPSVSLISSS
jgi:hypothetical protein